MVRTTEVAAKTKLDCAVSILCPTGARLTSARSVCVRSVLVRHIDFLAFSTVSFTARGTITACCVGQGRRDSRTLGSDTKAITRACL